MKRERMCTVCKAMKNREELLRVVKNPEGVFVDTLSKIQGRGAYICKTWDCVVLARKRSCLERSLSTAISSTVYDMLEDLVKDAR